MNALKSLAAQMRQLPEHCQYPDHRQRLAWRLIQAAVAHPPFSGPAFALLRSEFDSELRYQPPPAEQKPRIITGRWIDVERTAFNRFANRVVNLEAMSGAEFGAAVNRQILAVAAWLESLDAGQKDDRADGDAILFHGGSAYRVGGVSVAVTERESNVLESFLESPAMDSATLISRSGQDRAGEVLRSLACKPEFQPHIRLPGGRGKGGYAVTIRRASDGQ